MHISKLGAHLTACVERHTARREGVAGAYDHARAKSAAYLGASDHPRNTVSVATLGPTMGMLALASVLAEVDRPLFFSACCPQVRNPYQNVAFKNIGRA